MKNFFKRLYSGCKKGQKKYLKKNKSLSAYREKVSKLYDQNVLSSEEKLFDVTKKKLFNQYLGQKLLYQKFTVVYFFFYEKGGKFIFPLPIKWQKSLEESGMKINKTLSLFLYYLFLIYSFFLGVYLFLKIIIKYIYFNFFKKTQVSFNKFTIFRNVSTSRMNLNSRTQYNLVNWYKSNIDKSANIVLFSSQNKNKQYNSELAEANNEHFLFYKDFEIFKFIFLFIKSLADFRKISLIEFNLLLFEELVELNFYCSLKKNKIDKILFLWTNNIFKPLWVYKMEEKDIPVTILFNGFVNEIRINSDLSFDHDHEGLRNMTWNNYLVWDEVNAEFLRQKIRKKIHIQITGPNFFSDIDMDFVLPKKSVSIFGYENNKKNIGNNTIVDYEYCDKNFQKKFYNDIYDIATQNGFHVVIKRKNENKLQLKKYKYFFKNFFLKSNTLSINPNISAFRVIERSDIVISMPFTSTALIGSMYEKESIYYDPFRWIKKNDPSGSNLPLISGKGELENWFNSLKK
jgi:polysaccharide biosynthesis PFTS motif protein